MRKIDLTGKRYGRLLVTGLYENRKGQMVWSCTCDCGSKINAYGGNMKSGNSLSCGCLSAELSSSRKSTHGLSRTPEHNVWQVMKQRCLDPNLKNYHRYGGRGIKVADRWLGPEGFSNFLEDMGKRPSSKHSIERTDNDGNYSPENCKWALKLEQANNTVTNRFLTYDGKTMTIAQWAREVGLDMHTLYARLFRLNWPIKKALTQELR